MDDLASRNCLPCKGGIPHLTAETIGVLRKHIPSWEVVEDRLRKKFRFKDFQSALDFVNRIGRIAEEEQHHPDLLLSWGKVEAEIRTHAIDGLSENDFILAAKIDRL